MYRDKGEYSYFINYLKSKLNLSSTSLNSQSPESKKWLILPRSPLHVYDCTYISESLYHFSAGLIGLYCTLMGNLSFVIMRTRFFTNPVARILSIHVRYSTFTCIFVKNACRRCHECYGAIVTCHDDDRRLDSLELYFQVSRQRYIGLNIFIQGIPKELTVTLERGYLVSGDSKLRGERIECSHKKVSHDNWKIYTIKHSNRREC